MSLSPVGASAYGCLRSTRFRDGTVTLCAHRGGSVAAEVRQAGLYAAQPYGRAVLPADVRQGAGASLRARPTRTHIAPYRAGPYRAGPCRVRAESGRMGMAPSATRR